jgi:hypothetical protein
MPSLFLSVKETSYGKDMNMNAYKNIGGYISKIQVESFLIETLLALTQKALKNVHMLLVL